jgi:hypothetical protein
VVETHLVCSAPVGAGVTWVDLVNAVMVGAGCSLFYAAGNRAGERREHRMWMRAIEIQLQAHAAPAPDGAPKPASARERG